MTFLRTASLLFLFAFFSTVVKSQITAPVNGVADVRNVTYAFTNATIVKDAQTT